MLTILRTLYALLPLIVLALMVSSFSPLPLSDFDRFTVRIAAIIVGLVGYAAYEARTFVKAR